MGLINAALEKTGLSSLTTKTVNVPQAFGPDFPEGFQISEYFDGRVVETITLAGSWMPFQPFKFGGTQEIKKEYYAGNSEPTVQVLGSRENSITINGRLKLKKLKDLSLRTEETNAAYEMQKQIEAMRIRGNLVKIKLRDWYRYAFIEEAVFDMSRKIDIGYTITFSVIGFNIPKNSMFLGKTDENPVVPNKQLASRASELFAASVNYPRTMPQSLQDVLNGYISTAAEAINLVTGFVDGVVQDANSILASANRAVGLIKNAKAKVSETNRAFGQIKANAEQLGFNVSTNELKAAAVILNYNHIHKMQANNATLMSLLNDLQNKYRSMITNLPFRRHMVRSGDTLQKISIIYYNTADNWDEIYKANKLLSTDLVVGSVLEIPRL